MWPAMHRPLTSGRKHRLRLPAPLRVAVWLLLAVILLPYVLTPLYAVVNPVSTLMIWRRITGEPEPAKRLFGTAATVGWSVASGAEIVRVHDVAEMVQVVRMVTAILRGV